MTYFSIQSRTSTSDAVVDSSLAGDWLFRPPQKGVEWGYIVAIHDKLGSKESNTLISKYNKMSDTSVAEKYPNCVNTTWYKDFVSAAADDETLIISGFNKTQKNVKKIIDVYTSTIKTNYEIYCDAILSGTKFSKEELSKVFVSLCITAYRFKLDINE